MLTLTSQLVIELLDRVTTPAGRAANALAGISNTIQETNGQPITFGDRLNAAITRNNRALAQARGGLVDAVASFYALRGAIGAPIQAAANFESAMADVAKVVDFPTPEAFQRFQQDLFALSREIPIAVTGLADIAAAAGQAGIAGDDLVRFTDAAARIGVAFDISAEQAGGSMANLMTALGLTIDETVSLSDAMNHLSNSQASSAADILSVVQRVGAQASMFGFTAEETSAFASAMLAAGARSEVAATSFRNMGAALTRGSAATSGQREALQELGLDAEDTARKMQENAVETTIDVLRRIGQLPAEQRAAISSQLFGNEARALGPLLTNLGLVEETLGMVGDEAAYAGSAFAEFETRNNTFQANMQRFQNVLTELQINIGNALMPAITQLGEAVTPLIARLSDLANAYPEVTLAVVGATAAVIAFKGAMAALRFAGLLGRGGVLSLIAAGYDTIGRAAIGARRAATNMIGLHSALAAMSGRPLGTLGRLGAGLKGIALAVPGVSAMASGVSAIGAAIATISAPVWGTFAVVAAAVAATGIAIWRYWDRISAVFRGVSSAIGEALQPALDWVVDKLSFMTPLVEAFGAAWDWVGEKVSGIGDMLSTVFTRETLTEDQIAEITERAREATEGIIGWFTSIPTRLGEMASDLVAAGQQLIQSLWDGAVARFDVFLDWVRGIPGRIVDAIGRIDLTGIIRWPEPPDWWMRLTGGDAPQPVTPAEIEERAVEQGRTPEAEAAATLDRLRADGPLPTETRLSGLSSQAEELRSRMLSLRREIDRLSSGPGNGAARSAEARAAYAELETQLEALEQQITEGTARADEMNAALVIIGGFDGTPSITTDSIDRAITRAQELGRALDSATGARDVPAPSGSNLEPEIDGARAEGGPISRGGRYLVGEEGPELITPSRAGFVNTFGAIHDAVAAMQRLPAAFAAVQSIGPQLVAASPVAPAAEESEGPVPQVNAPEAGYSPEALPRSSSEPFPKFDVQITVTPMIHTTEQVDPAMLSREIGHQMRSEVREAFRGVFADTGMRFA